MSQQCGAMASMLASLLGKTVSTILAVIQIRRYERIKKLEPLSIIAVSASAFEEDEIAGFEAGMTGSLPKPFTEVQLAKAIQVVMSTKHDITRIRENQERDVNVSEVSGRNEDVTNKDGTIDKEGSAAIDQVRPNIRLRLIASFLDHSPKVIEQLTKACDEGDLVEIKFAAHTLKSSSAQMNLMALSSKLFEIELHAKTGDLFQCRELLGGVLEMFELASDRLLVEQSLSRDKETA